MTHPIYSTQSHHTLPYQPGRPGQLRVTPDELRRLAAQLEQAAADIQGHTRTVAQVMGELQDAWRGQAAGQFQATIQHWDGSTVKVVATLLRLGERLRDAANRLEQADLDAARLAAGGADVLPVGQAPRAAAAARPGKVHDHQVEPGAKRLPDDSGGPLGRRGAASPSPDLQKEAPVQHPHPRRPGPAAPNDSPVFHPPKKDEIQHPPIMPRDYDNT